TKARRFADSLIDGVGPEAGSFEISKANLNRVLSEDELVLAYDVTETGILIYSIRRSGIVDCRYKPISRKALEALVRNYMEKVSFENGADKTTKFNKLIKFDRNLGMHLYNLLLGHAVTKGLLRDGTRLTIVPDDFLGVVPFEMLVVGERPAPKMQMGWAAVSLCEFLGDRWQVSYYQSVTDLLISRCADQKASTERKLLVVADPVYSSGDQLHCKDSQTRGTGGTDADKAPGTLQWPRLAPTKQLADDLKRAYPGQADVLDGFAATKGEFLAKIKRQKYQDVVFAIHGYVGDALPEPALVLGMSKDGDGPHYLGMSEIIRLRLNTDTVVLAACHTGTGEVLPGEGVLAMGRAFRYAGARTVLTSSWSMDVTSTVQLVTSFYANLRNGKTKRDALRIARKELRRDPHYDHPFFWAGLILAGEGD
ncbi:MAG: CHAT domain-containing protein, partial [Pseudomonadota bacterium]